MDKTEYEYLANQIFNAALEVHKEFNAGLLESVYSFGLIKELQLRNIHVGHQIKVPLFIKATIPKKNFL